MRFAKMHGTGNDYIYVNGWEETVEDKPALAREICRRRYGIGADGVIFVCPSLQADVRMEMYNADGSRGAMCGNGIRCLGRFAYEKGLVNNKEMLVETDAGFRKVRLIFQEGKMEKATVDMGKAVFGEKVSVRGILPVLYQVDMGNPHGVLFDLPQTRSQLEKKGVRINQWEEFPDGINVEFVQVLDRENIAVQVWERGSGITLSCGTGACAAAALCMEKGMVEGSVRVHLPGGILEVEKDKNTDHLFLCGPAEMVYEGTYHRR